MKLFGARSSKQRGSLPDHLQRPDFRRYFDTLASWIPIEELSGLEIGPMDKPLVSKAKHKVKYLDAFPFEVIYERCKQNPNRDESRIVQLDYVTGNRQISASVDQSFDYVTASHVIEHLPNPLGWLRDLSKVLNPGGKVFLVVPDRRFTFDVARPLTTLGEIIENDMRQLDKPSFRSVFDQRFYHRALTSHEAWRALSGQCELNLGPTSTASNAYEFAKRAEFEHIDVHCSVFEPGSFEELIKESHALGIQPFRCVQVEPTSRPFLDFMALLEVAR